MPVKNIIPGQHATKEKLQRSRELRREMTPAEKILWEELRGSKLGVRFRRQQVIQGFIVDFYCHKSVLVMEVDGDIHDLQKEEDERREPPLSFGHLPQIRQWKVGLRTEHLNRRIWGRLGDGLFPAKGARIHPSSFCIHPCSLSVL